MSLPTIFTDDDVSDKFSEIFEEKDEYMSRALARIPGLFGHSKKASFLMYRSIGVPEDIACHLVGVTDKAPNRWRSMDADFKKFELEKLAELRKSYGQDMIEMGFILNMTMMIAQDSKLIRKAIVNPESLSEREFDLYGKLRKSYSTAELLALKKSVDPDKHPDGVIQLVWATPEQQRLEAVNPIDAEYSEVE